MNKTFSKKSTIIILIALALLTAGLACGLLILSQKDNNLNWNTVIKHKGSVVDNEEDNYQGKVIEGEDGWNSYQNEKLGFGFRYPNVWNSPSVEIDPIIDYGTPHISMVKKDREKDGYGSIQGRYDFNFTSTGSLEGNVKFVSSEYRYIFDDLNLKEIDIKNGKVFCGLDEDKLYGMNPFCKLISAKHFISLQYQRFGEELESSEKAFKEIISTFEFYK